MRLGLKLIRLFCNVVAVLVSFIASGNDQTGYDLMGKIDGFPNNWKIYLINREGDTINSASIIDGVFKMKGEILGMTNYYFLVTKRQKLDSIKFSKYRSNPIWLENKKMIVRGSVKSFGNLELEGSKTHQDFLEVQKIEASYHPECNANCIAEIKEFVKRNPGSLFTPYLLSNMHSDYSLKELVSAYENMSNDAKHSNFGLTLVEIVEYRKKYDSFWMKGPVGSLLPDYNVSTTDGRIMSIHSIIAKNRYTLLDYWASWCGPCRANTPYLSKAYKDFQQKGFEIVGISTDKSSIQWQKAIVDDKLPWVQCRDNIDSSYKKIFNMGAIPGYILVDSNFIIKIADYHSNISGLKKSAPINIREDELYKILSKLLK